MRITKKYFCPNYDATSFLIVALRSRGGPNKCPMAISDLVLLHNKAAEALARGDRVGFDFYSGMADLKALF